MNDNTIEHILKESLADTVSPDAKMNLELVNQAKRIHNSRMLSSDYKKSIFLCIGVLLPIAVLLAAILLLFIITNLFIKIFIIANLLLGACFMICFGMVGLSVLRKEAYA